MRIVFLVTLLSLTGCAASIPPVEVTRFHVEQQIAPGSVRVSTDPTLEAAAYAAAVTRALGRIGFADAAGTAKPVYTARTSFSRSSREQAKQSPVSIGIGGGSFGRNVGVGVGTSVGLGSKTRTIIMTRLSVLLVQASDGKTVWEGRAQTEAPANAPAAQPGLAAEKLANALFKDFPGVSGQTITVP
jgi:Domain of unknown function (DUF4136)